MGDRSSYCFTAQDAVIHPFNGVRMDSHLRFRRPGRYESQCDARQAKKLVAVPGNSYFLSYYKCQGMVYMPLEERTVGTGGWEPPVLPGTLHHHDLQSPEAFTMSLHQIKGDENPMPLTADYALANLHEQCKESRPSLCLGSAEVTDPSWRNATDYGSNGNDCVYRLFQHVFKHGGIRLNVEQRLKLLYIELLYWERRESSKDPACRMNVRECVKITKGALAVKLKREAFRDIAEFAKAWRDHLLKAGGRLDMLGLILLARLVKRNVLASTSFGDVMLYEDPEQPHCERVILTTNGRDKSHILYSHEKHDLNKKGNFSVCKEMVETFLNAPLGGGGSEERGPLRAITGHTNERRLNQRQEPLTWSGNMSVFDPQAHDPGEFGQLSVINAHANLLRPQRGQSPLKDSNSRSDRDMYGVNFHEKDTELLAMDSTGSTLESRIDRYMGLAEGSDARNKDSAGGSCEKEIPITYLSKMSFYKLAGISFLWDSGATKHVLVGELCSRIRQGYEVAYNHPEKGSVHAKDADKL